MLALSGVLMLLLAAVGFGATVGSRVLNAVLGLVAMACAVYLIMTVFIDEGTYRMPQGSQAQPIQYMQQGRKVRRLRRPEV